MVFVEGVSVHVSPTEYAILELLARHRGWLVTHPEILTRVWGAEYGDEHHMLRVNMSQLRGKLGSDPYRYILTRPALGYMIP